MGKQLYVTDTKTFYFEEVEAIVRSMVLGPFFYFWHRLVHRYPKGIGWWNQIPFVVTLSLLSLFFGAIGAVFYGLLVGLLAVFRGCLVYILFFPIQVVIMAAFCLVIYLGARYLPRSERPGSASRQVAALERIAAALERYGGK